MSKIALITAGHKGLGLGWSKHLASKGYEVIIAGRSKKLILDAIGLINTEGGIAHALELDVASEKSIENLANKVDERFGKLDLLVNNAGINPKDFKDKNKVQAGFNLEYLDPEVLIDVYRVNSLGPILMVKHFKPLLEAGEDKTVLNISSWLSSVTNTTFGGHHAYVSSKNLLNILNKTVALEIKDSGIKCFNVNPGWVKTDMGGEKALLTVEESVNFMFNNVFLKAGIEDTGSFYNYDGKIHPW